jgi:hypothetical protein
MTGPFRPAVRHLRLSPLAAALVVLAVVGLVALGLVLTGSGSGRSAGATAGSSTPAASGTPALSSRAPTPAAGTPQGAAAPAGDPNRLPPSLAPVALGRSAAVGNGITAEVASLAAFRASAHGPGNIAGPALRATVRITNGTGKPVSLDGVAVDLTYGKAASPASPVDDPSQAPFRGTVEPGGTAVGVYVFSVPSDDRNVVTLSVGYQAGAPFLVFTGSAR